MRLSAGGLRPCPALSVIGHFARRCRIWPRHITGGNIQAFHIQHNLAELAHLGYDRASELGADGAQAVTKGVESFNALHLDQKLDRFGRGLKKLFR